MMSVSPQFLMMVLMLMLAGVTVLVFLLFRSQSAMLVLASLAVLMALLLVDVVVVVVGMVVVVGVGAAVVSCGVLVAVEDLHDVEVAGEAEEGGGEHDERLLDDGQVEDALGGLIEELNSDHPDDGDVDERAQRLHLLVAEGKHARTGLVALVDGVERYGVGGDIREQVEGVGEDGDGVRVVAAQELHAHEDQGDHRDPPQLPHHDAVLLLHLSITTEANPIETPTELTAHAAPEFILELRKRAQNQQNNLQADEFAS